jgi:hypothetical protein
MTRDANDIAREHGIDALRDSFDRAAIHGSLSAELVITRASDMKPERVRWLWPDRFPLGKCTLIAGEGGLGKSMVLAWIATTVSKGGAWPCSEGESPKGSIINPFGRRRCGRYNLSPPTCRRCRLLKNPRHLGRA